MEEGRRGDAGLDMGINRDKSGGKILPSLAPIIGLFSC